MPEWCIRRPVDRQGLLGRVCRVLGLVVAACLPPTAASAHGPAPDASWRQRPALTRPVAVFGRDDRTLLPQSHARIGRGIGILTNPKARSVCTAFCVSDTVIATAAHCLFRTDDEPTPKMEDFTFSRVKDDPSQRSRIAGSTARSALASVVAGSTSLSVRPPIDATRDWAMARLAAPICRGHALPIATAEEAALDAAAAADRLMLAGYHRDFAGWRIALSRRCEIKRLDRGVDVVGFRRDFIDPDRLILHTCDTGGASSGSPLLIESERGPVVIGINVGTYVQSKVMMQNGEVVHRFKSDEVANTAASIIVPSRLLPALESAEPLLHGAQVRELQRLLAGQGLYAGPLDGTHGLKLKDAIEAYEKTAQMQVTGLPSRALLTRLGGGAVLAKAEETPRLGVGQRRQRKAGGTSRRTRQSVLQ